MGIKRPVTSHGAFPPVPRPATAGGRAEHIAADPVGWTNYRSSEDDPAVTRALLASMVQNGWAIEHSSWPSLTAALGASDIPISKLALISKQKVDGSWKHRIIWDLLRSDVNSLIH
jgi:hypothetical protein